MIRFVALLCIFTLSSSAAWTQATIYGRVTDQETGQAIIGANVFLAQTTHGTVTDEQGDYTLENVPAAPVRLSISYIGYERFDRVLTPRPGGRLEMNVTLHAQAVQLEEVEIISLKERRRRRLVNRFTDAFFGQTQNARHCTLLNPEALRLDPSGEGLEVSADELLVIENRALGYKVYFLLDHFQKDGPEVSYSGKPLFELLLPADEAEQEQWNTNRRQAFLGSERHFAQALFHSNLPEEGFSMNLARQTAEGTLEPMRNVRPADVTRSTTDDSQKELRINTFLQVVYYNEEDVITRQPGQRVTGVEGLGRRADRDMVNQESGNFTGNRNRKPQVSYWFARTAAVAFHENGTFLRPELVRSYGYWGYEGVADMLPLDYELDQEVSDEVPEAIVEAPEPLPTEVAREEPPSSPDNPVENNRETEPVEKAERIQASDSVKDQLPDLDSPEVYRANEGHFLRQQENRNGMADRLERDFPYQTPRTARRSSASAEPQQAEAKGFRLNRMRIPLDEIYDGGPPRDGIPAIDRPNFTSAAEDDFLQAEDPVIGVVYEGVAKAYPIAILNYHEIVNDRFGQTAVVITYCPLCASGMAFLREIGGRERTFGLSGLIYNSDMLLFDRETESLWSQLMMQAVSGRASGTELTYIPTEQTTWADWSTRYPETLVLSRNSGFVRDYSKAPYWNYESSPSLLFPVAREDDRLPRKARVLGVEINGRYKAYPLSFLTPEMHDTFAGQELLIRYDAAAGTAQITTPNGLRIPTVELFWFAWYAFHPETDVFE